MSKTFLSIASGPGIGLATARRFGREGYCVVLAGRNIARLGPVLDTIHVASLRTVAR